MVLNLASEGKIRPTHAWNKQNNVNKTPISCILEMNSVNVQHLAPDPEQKNIFLIFP